jgi:hypothetical protein
MLPLPHPIAPRAPPSDHACTRARSPRRARANPAARAADAAGGEGGSRVSARAVEAGVAGRARSADVAGRALGPEVACVANAWRAAAIRRARHTLEHAAAPRARLEESSTERMLTGDATISFKTAVSFRSFRTWHARRPSRSLLPTSPAGLMASTNNTVIPGVQVRRRIRLDPSSQGGPAVQELLHPSE